MPCLAICISANCSFTNIGEPRRSVVGFSTSNCVGTLHVSLHVYGGVLRGYKSSHCRVKIIVVRSASLVFREVWAWDHAGTRFASVSPRALRKSPCPRADLGRCCHRCANIFSQFRVQVDTLGAWYAVPWRATCEKSCSWTLRDGDSGYQDASSGVGSS